MEDKRKCVFIILVMLTLAFLAVAQTASTVSSAAERDKTDDLNYFLAETDKGLTFIQKLNWDAMEYALRYEVIIQRLDSGGYADIAFVGTETNMVEVSLLAGNYRYKVLAYNLLDQLETESPWQDFLIFQAVQPDLLGFSPRTLYLDQTDVLTLDLDVRKIDPKADIFLQFNGDTRKLYAEKIKQGENTINLLFAPKSLLIGEYTVSIVNPGGLSDSKKYFMVRYFKAFDVNFSVGYSPLLLLYGKEMKDYFDNMLFPLGFSSRLGLVFSKKDYGYWGAELFGAYNYLKKESDTFKLIGNNAVVHANALFQLPVIKKKLYLNFRLGGGVTALSDMYFEYGVDLRSKKYNSVFPSVGAGASVQVLLVKGLYLDVAADYVHVFANKMPMGDLIPTISLGWQF